MIAELQTKRAPRRPFGRYSTYLDHLQLLALGTSSGKWNDDVSAALDGQAGAELRRIAPLSTRRRFGAYFTGSILSERLTRTIRPSQTVRCYDPTCGGGDLLLAVARKFPLGATVHKTLTLWGKSLAGTDLHAEFVECAKTRLVLLAKQRHHETKNSCLAPQEYFPQIRVGDGLLELEAFERAGTILMNPPFGMSQVLEGCTWAGGRITAAASFVAVALQRVKSGTEILALLPEVLRSGAFSSQWRDHISDLAEIKTIRPCGIFDASADVDVFLLRLIRRGQRSSNANKRWPANRRSGSVTVGDLFNIHVGRVVPHRDSETGPSRLYIHPRCVPPWKVMTNFPERRRYEGMVYEPPFVVVRRTSRPGHPYRAIATIIAGSRSIAVENHLIVCEPKDQKMATCKVLLRGLKTASVNAFLDRRIRCRHLTVGAVQAIPLADSSTRKRMK